MVFPKQICVTTGARHGKCKLHVCECIVIRFGFVSDWLRKWHELCQPIRQHSKAKPKETCSYMCVINIPGFKLGYFTKAPRNLGTFSINRSLTRLSKVAETQVGL